MLSIKYWREKTKGDVAHTFACLMYDKMLLYLDTGLQGEIYNGINQTPSFCIYEGFHNISVLITWWFIKKWINFGHLSQWLLTHFLALKDFLHSDRLVDGGTFEVFFTSNSSPFSASLSSKIWKCSVHSQ